MEKVFKKINDMTKKIITAWHNLPKESKRFFWERAGLLDYEISLALEANDVPTLKQVSVFHYGKEEVESIRGDLIGLAVEELK